MRSNYALLASVVTVLSSVLVCLEMPQALAQSGAPAAPRQLVQTKAPPPVASVGVSVQAGSQASQAGAAAAIQSASQAQKKVGEGAAQGARPEAKSPGKAAGPNGLVCTTGRGVTLDSIAKVPGLAEHLKSFDPNLAFKSGATYAWNLSGNRRDISSYCEGIFAGRVLLDDCHREKPAGEARMKVTNKGVLRMYVDGRRRGERVQVPINKICSNGSSLTIDYKYDRVYSELAGLVQVRAGPWNYRLEITKDGNRTVSSLTLNNGRRTYKLNRSPILMADLRVTTPPVDRRSVAQTKAGGSQAQQKSTQ